MKAEGPPAASHVILRDTFVRDVESHASLPSTSTRAMEVAQQPDLTTPLLIITGRQTAGRGRGDHVWWSSDGALTFSLLVEPEQFELPPEKWSRAALAAGVAVADVLAELVPGEQVGLKWPNDVFLAERKVCGILTEVPACRWPVPARLVIGVGINVNNSFAAAPGELQRIGIAACDVSGAPFDLTDVLVHTLRRIEANVRMLARSDPQLPARWRELSLLTGRQVAVQQGSQLVNGRCLEIDDEGALVLDTPSGRQRLFGGTIS